MRTSGRLWAICAIAFAVAVALSIAFIPRVEDIDSGSYRLMAAGEAACKPYANRVLHPAIVHTFCRMFEPSDPRAFDASLFFLIAVVSSAVFYACVLSLMREVRPRWLTFLFLVSPLWWVWGGNIYIQDMFAAAVTAFLFLALRGGFRFRTACVFALLFILQFTRESTMVLAVSLAALAAWRRERLLACCAVAAMALGMAAVAWASRDALPNANELGGLTYLACKTVANGLRNLTGVIPWNDGYAAKLPWHYPDAPLWKFTLPAFLQAGNVREVGVYAIDAKCVLRTALAWFAYFPGVIAFAAWKLKRRPDAVSSERNTSPVLRLRDALCALRVAPLYVQYAFAAGFVFWFLAPFSGASLERLAGYSWPLFWIAVPWLFSRGNGR